MPELHGPRAWLIILIGGKGSSTPSLSPGWGGALTSGSLDELASFFNPIGGALQSARCGVRDGGICDLARADILDETQTSTSFDGPLQHDLSVRVSRATTGRARAREQHPAQRRRAILDVRPVIRDGRSFFMFSAADTSARTRNC